MARRYTDSQYVYDPSHDPYYFDPYYSEMTNNTSDAAGPSRYSTDLYPLVTSQNRGTNDPISRPLPPPRMNNSNNTTRDRDSSPPRKTSRQNDGRPQDIRTSSAIERGVESQDIRLNRDRDRDRPPAPTPKSATFSKLEPVIHAFVEACKAQQDARKERLDIENNNAKYLKYRDRDDISKENKAKAEKASEEISEAKRKDEIAWLNVETQTREMLLSALGQERNRTRPSLEISFPKTPPQQASVQTTESDLEPGEIVVPKSTKQSSRSTFTASGPPPVRPVPSSLAGGSAPTSAAITAPDIDAASIGKGKTKATNSVTRASILTKFEEVDLSLLEVKSDTEDRLNQMESNMEDLVRLEVESRVRKARVAFRNSVTQGSAEVAPVPSAGNNQSEVPVGKSAQLSHVDSMPHPLTTSKNNKPQEEPGMSHEQVSALLESMRQSIREEFDQKLFQQSKVHKAEMENFHTLVAAQFKKEQQIIATGQHSHLEILNNHQDLLNRHEQLWQGTLGLFAKVPKPTNTP